MQRTLVPGRFVSLALLGALALAACGEREPFQPPPGKELNASPVPPPPISGGTLIITREGAAVAADPDRDQIWVTALEDGAKPQQIALKAGDEPGRLVEDGSGKVHVALRRGGAVVTLDPVSAKIEAVRPVCPAPRGLAYDAGQDLIHVACEGGELVSLPARGGDATRKLRLARDLRDVIVDGDRLLVSQFRAAKLIVVDKDGTARAPLGLPSFEPDNLPGQTYSPSVAWRTVGMPTGGALMLHQRAMSAAVQLTPGGYYTTAGCDGSILHAAVSVFRSPSGQKGKTELLAADAFPRLALPVDVAVSSDGEKIAMVGAGSGVVIQTRTSFIEEHAGSRSCQPEVTQATVEKEPVAIAFDEAGHVVVQTRAPALLILADDGSITTTIPLPGDSRADTGHAMFHRPPNGSSGIACASCHPEGHDDGRPWTFNTPAGVSFVRRTQNIGIGGGLLATAPFHWSGDLSDLDALMDEVFVLRMGGAKPGPRAVKLFSSWLDQVPALPSSPSADEPTIDRGKALFESAAVGCAECHAGPKLTNNKTVDVGTGLELQVPSLISIASRTPLMHDGCAKSLRDRFLDPACTGGDKHGHTSQLTPAELDDLTAYLESL